MRSEFWWFQLFIIILEIGVTTLDHMLLGFSWDRTITPLAFSLDMLTVLPLAAVTARRLHDIGRSGWWQAPIFILYLLYLDVVIPYLAESVFMSVVMLVGGLYSLAIIFALIRDGDPVSNKYGPNPKQDGVADVFA